MQTFYTVKDAKALSKSIITANPDLQVTSFFEEQLDKVFDELSSKYSDERDMVCANPRAGYS